MKRAGQKGMTLVEVIIATGIGAVVTAALALVIYNLMTVTERNNDATSTLSDVQNAVYMISYDAKMAGSTDLTEGDPAASEVLFSWIDGGGAAHSSRYYISGTELIRDYNGNTHSVAKSISSIEFTVTASNLNYFVKSTTGRLDTSESFTGTVYFRPTT